MIRRANKYSTQIHTYLHGIIWILYERGDIECEQTILRVKYAYIQYFYQYILYTVDTGSYSRHNILNMNSKCEYFSSPPEGATVLILLLFISLFIASAHVL